MNPVCSTYGVKLVQKLHEVFLKLKDDLLTLKEEKKRRKYHQREVNMSVCTVCQQRWMVTSNLLRNVPNLKTITCFAGLRWVTILHTSIIFFNLNIFSTLMLLLDYCI